MSDSTNDEKVAGLYQKYCSLWHALAACALAAVFPNHSSLFIDAAIYSSPTFTILKKDGMIYQNILLTLPQHVCVNYYTLEDGYASKAQ